MSESTDSVNNSAFLNQIGVNIGNVTPIDPILIPIAGAAETFCKNNSFYPPSNVYLDIGNDWNPPGSNSSTSPGALSDPTSYAAVSSRFNSYLNSVSSNTLGVPVTDWNSFSQGFYADSGVIHNANGTVSLISPPAGSQTGLYQGFLDDYASAMGIQLDSQNNIIGGDFLALSQDPNISPPMNLADPNSLNNPFVATFNQFLKSYSPPASISASNAGVAFLNAFHSFIAPSTTITGQPYVDATTYSQNKAAYSNLPSYKLIYECFSNDPTGANFESFLSTFYQNQVNQNGFFSPSLDLSSFVSAVYNTKGGDSTQPSAIGSTLAGNDSDQVLILNRIILLLISMIQTIQNVGIAQANRLNFLTQYQNVYTGLETQVPVFLQDGSSPIGGTSSDAGTARNELNSSFNGIVTDNIRSLRGVQENNAKTLQSNINTTNDSVNQQSDMATTFLQQMSTLLTTILR